jgi:ParB family chromosome partitioning protein
MSRTVTKELPTLMTVSLPLPTRQTLALCALVEHTHGASNHLLGSLRSVGQLDPILVEQLSADQFVIREGNRRVAAARKLGWIEIQADVYPRMAEASWALVVAGAHNRSENPVEEARVYTQLATQLTLAGIHANTGVPVQKIRARLALMSLPADVLDAVGTKHLALGVAEAASRLKGVHLKTAITAIRAKIALDEAFTQADLKEITVARRQSFGRQLASLPTAPVTLIPEAELLALEVQALCERRGVQVQELLRELRLSTPLVTGDEVRRTPALH